MQKCINYVQVLWKAQKFSPVKIIPLGISDELRK